MITTQNPPRYITPNAFTQRLFNPLISGLTKLGLSIRGSRVLEVRGRSTGQWRAVPVNPLLHDGCRFLVAPRGETQWVRNLRVAGGGRLRKGRTVEEFSAIEVTDDRKLGILRAYLDAWAFEVGKFFDGITADSTDAEIGSIAAGFPVFEIASA